MFERVKFITRYVTAYRRSRDAGGAHEAALDAAAHHVLDQEPVRSGGQMPADPMTVPPSAADLWTHPDTACALDGGAWFGDGPFEITPPHISLLRQARFSWEGAERGAPMLDPRRPYGRSDLLVQLAAVFGTDDGEELAQRHVEMYFVIARALKHGALSPGRHALRNIGPADVREALRGYGDDATDADRGLGDDGLVTLTDDHLQLLRAIEIRWPSSFDSEDRLDLGEYPATTADPKRPYGDFTFIEVDMARILGVLPPRPEGGGPAIFEPSPELAERLQRLHWQMLVAMQVFVEQMALAPGIYGLDAS